MRRRTTEEVHHSPSRVLESEQCQETTIAVVRVAVAEVAVFLVTYGEHLHERKEKSDDDVDDEQRNEQWLQASKDDTRTGAYDVS